MNYLTKEEIFRDNGISTAYANTGLNAQQLIAIVQATQKALEAKNKAEAVTGLCNCERPVDHCTFKSNCQVINTTHQPDCTANGGEASGVVELVLAEIEKATAKFPTWPTDPLHALAVLGEEYGELNKAVLQCVYEPHKSTIDDVRMEAIQTAAMSIRFLMSLEKYQYKTGEQHSQSTAALAETKGES